MEAEQFTVRFAEPEDDPAIAALVVEGFLDKFRPVFGSRMDRSLKIMERWVDLEHLSGGVTSLVVEGYATSELAGSVGIRTEASREDVLARGLWKTLTRNLGFPRAVWATTLLSYPRYSSKPSEAYVERLVVSPPSGARAWPGDSSPQQKTSPETGAKSRRPARNRRQPARPPPLRIRRLQEVSRQRSLITAYFLDIREWLYLKKEL